MCFHSGLVWFQSLDPPHLGLDQLVPSHFHVLWGLRLQSLVESVSHSVVLTLCKPHGLMAH